MYTNNNNNTYKIDKMMLSTCCFAVLYIAFSPEVELSHCANRLNTYNNEYGKD